MVLCVVPAARDGTRGERTGEADVVTAGWPEWASWTNLDAVATLLASGAAPNARLHATRNTPLHEALWEPIPVPEIIETLIAYGADVEAVNDLGETPLWCAVRRGCARSARALLDVGADPWRPSVGGRSAGDVALSGPLADMFARLPGAPRVDERDRRWQAEADALIASYVDLPRTAPSVAKNICVAFVRGADEDEVIRRVGARPADCPLGTLDDCMAAFYELDRGREAAVLWVGTPSGGGVVVLDQMGVLPVDDEFCRRVSADGAIVASMFARPADGDQRVHYWRDGGLVARSSPYLDPGEDDPPEAWLCRFGDHAHPSRDVARELALMTMLTDVLPGAGWLGETPKRVVRVPVRASATRPARVRR